MNWYVVHCLTGHEEDVRSKIKGDDIARAVVPIELVVVPRRIMRERRKSNWVDVERVLFPGYVFLQADMTPAAYYNIKSIAGVIRVLGTPRPVPLMEDEITLLLQLSVNGNPLGMSEALDEGGKVTVISGPLKGLEGNIIKLDKRRFRAKVNVAIMGEPRVVELAVSVIKKS